MNTLNLLGIHVHQVSSHDLIREIETSIQNQKYVTLLHLNIHGAVLAHQKEWLRAFYNQADLVFCDGDGVRWGMRMLGMTPPPKIPLTRWVWELAALCEDRGRSLFLLGGNPGIAELASEKLREKHPKLKIAGTHHGYFAKSGSENEKVIEEINRVKPDVLIVCFGMPEQEKWILENRSKLNAPVCLPSGGVLDYVAGRLGKAPQWMIACHLEWLFRICQEPRRLLTRYLTEIPYFFACVLKERLFRAHRE